MKNIGPLGNVRRGNLHLLHAVGTGRSRPASHKREERYQHQADLTEDISVGGVKSRLCCLRMNLGDDPVRFKNFSGIDNAAISVNSSRNSGIGGAYNGDTVFDSSHSNHAHVLIRGGALTEPGVIGDVNQITSALFYGLADQVWEYNLEADVHSEFIITQLKNFSILASFEVSNVRHHFIDKEQDGTERHKLTERHQVNFIVASQLSSLIGNKIRAVSQSERFTFTERKLLSVLFKRGASKDHRSLRFAHGL